MSNIIYYFTGRGNSLRIANDISKRLDDMEVKSMAGTVINSADTYIERIGIITPVIDLGIPSFVRKFIKTLKYSKPSPYIFAIVASGGMPGASLSQLKKCISEQGLELSAGFLISFGLEQEPEDIWNKQLDDMASLIQLKKKTVYYKEKLKDKLLTGFGNTLARIIIPREDKKFKVNNSCNSCGLCTKICPVKNIKIVDNKAS